MGHSEDGVAWVTARIWIGWGWDLAMLGEANEPFCKAAAVEQTSNQCSDPNTQYEPSQRLPIKSDANVLHADMQHSRTLASRSLLCVRVCAPCVRACACALARAHMLVVAGAHLEHFGESGLAVWCITCCSEHCSNPNHGAHLTLPCHTAHLGGAIILAAAANRPCITPRVALTHAAHMRVCACVRACKRVRMRACVRACMRGCKRACVVTACVCV